VGQFISALIFEEHPSAHHIILYSFAFQLGAYHVLPYFPLVTLQLLVAAQADPILSCNAGILLGYLNINDSI
jgi:hypothetical protein